MSVQTSFEEVMEREMEEYVLLCEDSLDGIFTGIYDAYQYKVYLFSTIDSF